MNDASRVGFFNQMERALKNAQELKDKLGAGSSFYAKLTDILTNLKQDIADFCMGRDLQRQDAIAQLKPAQ